MDKVPVYPGAIPLDTNLLQPQRNTEIALGYLMQAAFGTSTLIDGLAVVPTSPASMAVKVGGGSIITMTTVDTLTSGFGSLAVDNTTPLVKIGINTAATTMSALTAPVVAGQSQNWLLEAKFLEADGAPIALPYYNPTNAAVPYTGPSNTGTAQNTARTNTVQLQWVAGTAATTGTQNTPTPDAGWVGIGIVTVITNQTSITSSNIAPYSLAPYVPTKLASQRTKVFSNVSLYVSTTGSDTVNSGLSASSPFLTVQKAWNYIINSLDMNGFSVIVNVANGTYSSGLVAIGTPVGIGYGNTISFVGNTTTPANCVITTSNRHCFYAANGAALYISGFQMTATGTSSVDGNPAGAIFSNTGGSIVLNGNNTFASVAGSHIDASFGVVSITSSYTISGSAVSHYAVAAGGFLNTGSGPYVVTLTGTPAFSAAFVSASGCSNLGIASANLTFSGSATGQRYNVSTNAVVATASSGSTFFPGGTAGATATGGQYI